MIAYGIKRTQDLAHGRFLIFETFEADPAKAAENADNWGWLAAGQYQSIPTGPLSSYVPFLPSFDFQIPHCFLFVGLKYKQCLSVLRFADISVLLGRTNLGIYWNTVCKEQQGQAFPDIPVGVEQQQSLEEHVDLKRH